MTTRQLLSLRDVWPRSQSREPVTVNLYSGAASGETDGSCLVAEWKEACVKIPQMASNVLQMS